MKETAHSPEWIQLLSFTLLKHQDFLPSTAHEELINSLIEVIERYTCKQLGMKQLTIPGTERRTELIFKCGLSVA